jgi:PAS domain S-box-containing protein
MFTKVLQSTLKKELPAQLQSEEKLREINAELERGVAERTVGLEIANAELRRHVPKREGIEDQLKTSLREVADLKAALEEHAIVATANPQGNHRRMVSSSPKLTHWRSNPTFALIAAISVALLGAVALTGWLLHIESFKCIIPGSAPMKPNMAVGFLLCAAALALLSGKKMAKPIRVYALAVAVVVIGLTAVTLGEHFFGLDLGVDRWWFHDVPGEEGTLHPGRISLVTALCFLLTGSTLFTASLSISMRLRVPLVAGLGAGLLAMGALPLIGFLLEVLFGPQWNYMGMSISGVIGAVGFILLGSGLLALLQSETGLVWSLDALTTAGFISGILLMVVAAAVAFNFTKLMLETTNRVSHRQDLLLEIAEAMTDMAVLASDQRVYVIVGDEDSLKDRQQTKADLHQSVGLIRRLCADNPNQQRRLDQLEPLIAQRIEWEEQLIAAYRQHGFSAAQQMIATGHGLRLSDQIVRFLKETEGEEYGLLAKDRQQAETASITAFSLLPLGVFLSLGILIVGAFFLNARVSEQARADRALRQSEERMRAVLESALDCVITMDHQGRVMEFNPAAEKTFGYRREQAIGQLLSELMIPPSLRERHQKGLSRYLATGEAPVLGKRLELTAMRSNGAEFPVELAITRIGSQEPPMFTGFIRDTTEQKQGGDALRTSEAQLHTIVENLEEGVIISDLKGRLLHWNRAALKLHGYPDSDQDRRRFTELIDTFELSTKDGAPVSVEEWPLARILRGEKVQDLELRVQRIGCDWHRIFHYGGTLIRDATNQPLMAIVTATDITERKRADDQLKTSLREVSDLKAALDEHAIVAITDPRGKITYVNDKFCAISKYSREELIGQDHRIINSGYHSKQFIRNLWATIGGGDVWRGEIKNRAKDDSYYWVDTTIVPFLTGDGKSRQYVAIRADITERKRAEEELKASLKEVNDLKAALDEHAIVAMTNPQGKITYVNDKFCAISKFSREELLGQDHRIINSSYHSKEFIRELWTTIGHGRVWHGEIKNRAKDGSYYWVDTTIVPFLNDDGKPRQYVAIRADITERKRAEEELKASLKEVNDLKAALDEHAIVAMTNPQGKITYVNDKFCTISKYSREELLGQDHRIINSGYHPTEFIRDLWTTITHGKVWHGEIKNRAKDDSYYWVDTTIVPFLNEEGKPRQYVAIRADITERKRAEEEIRQLNAELEQRVGQRTAELEAANKELEAFSYSVSHDLRAPLRHVAGFVELLREDAAPSLSEKSVRYLATISQAAKRMGDLIDDLLAFSRVGRSEMQKNDVNLDELVQQTLSEFQVGTNGEEIIWDVCPLPTVRADRSMLRQVLVNLISNAVKFTGKRTRAEIEVGCASTETKEIVIFVRDNGVGFDQKYTEKLFGVFQRLHSSDEFEGTGIGLANVQRIIHRHGGRVWAEGAVDKGATFYFSIPKQTEA